MLIFDQLQKADRHLRMLSWIVAIGVLVLLGGLWWVQVVRSRQFVESQRTQSYRTVRVPAPRGKLMDRNGLVLAENRPVYSVSLYLGDRAWREQVRQQYAKLRDDARHNGATTRKANVAEKSLSWFGYEPSLVQLRKLSHAEESNVVWAARYVITSNIVAQLGDVLGQSLVLNEANFKKHYERSRVLPLAILSDLTPAQIARLQERGMRLPGVDMEIQPTRFYPHGTLAAHVLGYMRLSDDSAEGELAYFDYRLPDFRGVSGLEYSLDNVLRGRAGGVSVQVNNLGYRQSETVLSAVEPGHDVRLTIDAEIQRKAEYELSRAAGARAPVRGAAVVLDVRTGEIIAMASAPTFNPSNWIPKISPEIFAQYHDTNSKPMLNRAVFGNFPPGSTFKTMVALAGLEAGTLKTNEPIHVPPDPRDPAHGVWFIGEQAFRDLQPPGDYTFVRAYKKSSNAYFIAQGLRAGREAILRIGRQLHLGERTGIPLAQDSPGILPTPEWVQKHRGPWRDGDTGNLCIGQGDVAITPLQMAVAIAAVANGGRVLWPQLVIATNSQDEIVDPSQLKAVRPRIREQLGVSPQTLDTLHSAMLADTEDGDGSGVRAHVDGFRVCGKTGTAQVKHGNVTVDHFTWFASYAPYEDPRYAVVVMVQIGSPTGGSGGETCAPVAKKIYEALRDREKKSPGARGNSLAGK